MMCTKRLHPMEGDNVEVVTRADGQSIRKCLACKVARQKGDTTRDQLIDARRKELADMFGPFKTDGRWTDRAGCIGEDDTALFPSGPYNGRDAQRTIQRNCSWCPVRESCLIDALASPTTEGIHGGMLFPGAILKYDHVPLLETLIKRVSS